MAQKNVFLTQAEVKHLFTAITSKRDRAIFLLTYRHGLRASEVGQLQVSDVDFTANRLSIHRLKGSLDGNHPMRPDEAKAIRAYLRTRKADSPYLFTSNRGTPVSRASLHYLMRKYATKAGLPPEKQHFHCLKHSIATHLLDARAGIEFVRDWLGHKNIQNTLIYAQLTSRTRDEQARRVFASPQII